MVIPSLKTILLVLLAWVFLEWLRRVAWMRSLVGKNPPIPPLDKDVTAPGRISVIVPARDEEKNIGNCLSHLIKQDHHDYEIIVVDDRSTDRTGHLAENFKKLSPVTLKVVRIEKLPPGWTGKNHGMFVASKAASGEWLLFTDADTTHEPFCIRTALAKAEDEGADFLTLGPQVECRSFWENTVQPQIVGSLALWFNSEEVNKQDSKKVLANGQFILVRKKAYEAVGGNESVKNEVVEDVELAKKFLAGGFKVLFLNGTRLYSTRMYTSLAQILNGWTRIFTYLFEKKIAPILSKIVRLLVFNIFPFVVLTAEKILWISGSTSFSAAVFWASLAVCTWIVVIRFNGNRMVRANPWYAFLHPVGSVVMVWILASCVSRIATGGRSEWRGDRV